MAGYEFTDKLVFNDVYIHGTVRDANGVKMSKSLGNGIDPLEIVGQHGADTLRVSLILATPDGQDPWLSKNSFELGRNFVNKIFQASRFLQMRTPESFEIHRSESAPSANLSLPDRWILSKLQGAISEVESAFGAFRLSAALKALYEFAWNDFCSWYLELIKPDSAGTPIRTESLQVAYYTLERILRLLHPFAPFFSEELYTRIFAGGAGEKQPTLVFGPWPAVTPGLQNDAIEQSLDCIKQVVEGVRSVRSEMNVPPGKESDLYVRVADEGFGRLLEEHYEYFRSLVKVAELKVGVDVKKPPLSASLVVSGAEIYIPLAGLIDVEQERSRLGKELERLTGHLDKLGRKLGNQDFLANAPKDVVDRERAKKADIEERVEKLNRNLEQLTGW
ncbi:MAG TPA: class I tRNA ligase family protein, partial [candidate division Zixibacteria bacterium]|nr:class I tRNA ligase family protein [candidate division Zixibacteria bacterium]